jgi:hypothetical protein
MAADETYEYAGFRYKVWRDDRSKATRLTPLAGQHPAASKEKHLRAAMQCMLDDERERERKKGK